MRSPFNMQDRLKKVYNMLQLTMSTTTSCDKMSRVVLRIFPFFKWGLTRAHLLN